MALQRVGTVASEFTHPDKGAIAITVRTVGGAFRTFSSKQLCSLSIG